MADPALPRHAGPLPWVLRLLARFVAHATRPFAGNTPPNWYVYGTFVLLLALVGSVLLNVLLLALFLIARYG